MRISDWSSDVCSSDLHRLQGVFQHTADQAAPAGMRHAQNAIGAGQYHGQAVGGYNGQHLARACSNGGIGNGRRHAVDQAGLVCIEYVCSMHLLQPQRRSEEHTSELQSLMRISYAVFCLKKKKRIKSIIYQPVTTHDSKDLANK